MNQTLGTQFIPIELSVGNQERQSKTTTNGRVQVGDPFGAQDPCTAETWTWVGCRQLLQPNGVLAEADNYGE